MDRSSSVSVRVEAACINGTQGMKQILPSQKQKGFSPGSGLAWTDGTLSPDHVRSTVLIAIRWIPELDTRLFTWEQRLVTPGEHIVFSYLGSQY